MREPITILLVFMLSLSWGQYTPVFQNDSIVWVIKHEVFDAAEIGEIWLGNTVTIDSTLYREISDSWTGQSGYYREDTATGRVWFRGISDSSEWLIMDLSLALGDTFLVRMGSWAYSNQDSIQTTVMKVDTVQNRKVITLELMYGAGFIYEHLKFIEGIGPNASLIYAISQDDFPGYGGGLLVCKTYRDNDLVYAWNVADPEDCGPFIGISGTDFNWGSVYPNPFTTTVNIKLNAMVPATVVIYDLLGRPLVNSRFISSIQLDLSDIDDRVLLYKIFSEDIPPVSGTLLNLPEY